MTYLNGIRVVFPTHVTIDCTFTDSAVTAEWMLMLYFGNSKYAKTKGFWDTSNPEYLARELLYIFNNSILFGIVSTSINLELHNSYSGTI